ncbi:hypothetical protein [Amycolatopsis benzoatilytica]|uniref:PH-like domain-containing protein n=1 Tax=Amycolatopsis benzoatilytica TaxID=346045 RepID=UPI00037F009A|nr:hypothetical protein [Amycolatopsis benzoatilytica]
MERLLLTLGIVAFFLICLWGMWLGWRRKARSQSARIAPFPEIPADPGEFQLESTGVCVGTTTAGNWQDRVVTRGAGPRSGAVWRLHPDGVTVERGGLPDFWIPRASITGIRRDSRLAGKVTGTDVLLVITWQLGDVSLDTGFRGDDLADYPQWINELSPEPGGDAPAGGQGVLPPKDTDHDIKGGAQ